MKVIETVYNGYRFRSRTEARWAVFFDALGVLYEYEKEGFDLDGTWYLPDFWLPDLKVWVEIKGQEPTEDEREKIEKLVLSTPEPVIGCILVGAPEITVEHRALFPVGRYGYVRFEVCNFCLRPVIAYHGAVTTLTGEDGLLWGVRAYCMCASKFGVSVIGRKSLSATKAYDEAKKARFEHGETLPTLVKR